MKFVKVATIAVPMLIALSATAQANSISSWSCSVSGSDVTVVVNTASAVSGSATIRYDDEPLSVSHAFSNSNTTMTVVLDSNYDCSPAIVQVTDNGVTFDNTSN